MTAKQDWDNAPEGSTHIMLRKEQSGIFLKDLDRHSLLCSVWSLNKREKNVRFFLNDEIINIEGLTEKWSPKVGEECEYIHKDLGQWERCKVKYLGGNLTVLCGVDSFEFEIAFDTVLSELKLRPLRTPKEIEREEFVKNLKFIHKHLADNECFYETIFDYGYRLTEK